MTSVASPKHNVKTPLCSDTVEDEGEIQNEE